MGRRVMVACLAASIGCTAGPPADGPLADLASVDVSSPDLSAPDSSARADLAQAIDLSHPDLAGCSNGIQDGNESDIDCGGSCSPCADGRRCLGSGDCASNRCLSGICISCSDGIENGDETDIDCGGGCPGCAPGRACMLPGDCASITCSAGTCQSPPDFGGADLSPARSPFALAQTFTGEGGVVVGDLDRDGHLDIVIADPLTSLLGKGDGTFPVSKTSQGSGFGQMVLGDFDGDGLLDLVVASQDVSLYRGNGDGTFAAPSVVYTPQQGYSEGLITTDWNADGKLDLAFVAEPSPVNAGLVCDVEVVQLYGNGDGTFKPPAMTNIPELTGPIFAVDYDHDGRLDLVANTFGGACGYDWGRIYLYGGVPQYYQYTDKTGAAQTGITLVDGDWNGDGWVDFAGGVGPNGGELVVFMNLGGTLARSNTTFMVDCRVNATGDFDGDGLADLFVEDGHTLFGNGDGTFRPSQPPAFPVGFLTAVGDFNEDGKDDLVTYDYQNPGTVQILLAN